MPLHSTAGDIFWLAIDTEGNDPAVLRGAEETLREGAVTVLQFEYNGERGLWRDPNVLLGPIVEHLDALRYTCFLEASHKLYLLSRCWSPAFEWKAWSNVICAHQVRGGAWGCKCNETVIDTRVRLLVHRALAPSLTLSSRKPCCGIASCHAAAPTLQPERRHAARSGHAASMRHRLPTHFGSGWAPAASAPLSLSCSEGGAILQGMGRHGSSEGSSEGA